MTIQVYISFKGYSQLDSYDKENAINKIIFVHVWGRILVNNLTYKYQ